MKHALRPVWMLSLAFMAMLVLSAAVLSPRERDVIKHTFDVRPGETLFLDLDRGHVEVEVTDASKVFIELERVAQAESKEAARELLEQFHTYEFEREDRRGVHIRSRVDENRRGFSFRRNPKIKIHVRVRVPEAYNVNFSNGAGNIEITDVNGNIIGETGAGAIQIEDVRGEVEITSGAGNVEINGEITRAKVTTGAGNVELYGVAGEIIATTGTGNVYAEITAQPQQDSKLRTGAGNVTVSIADDVSVNLNGSTRLGNVECEFPIQVSKKFLSHSFSGQINGGGARIEMYVAVGNVIVKRR